MGKRRKPQKQYFILERYKHKPTGLYYKEIVGATKSNLCRKGNIFVDRTPKLPNHVIFAYFSTAGYIPPKYMKACEYFGIDIDQNKKENNGYIVIDERRKCSIDEWETQRIMKRIIY